MSFNKQLVYVAVSRGRYDAQIYTDDAQALGEAVNKDVSKKCVLTVETSGGLGRNQENLMASGFQIQSGVVLYKSSELAVAIPLPLLETVSFPTGCCWRYCRI